VSDAIISPMMHAVPAEQAGPDTYMTPVKSEIKRMLGWLTRMETFPPSYRAKFAGEDDASVH